MIFGTPRSHQMAAMYIDHNQQGQGSSQNYHFLQQQHQQHLQQQHQQQQSGQPQHQHQQRYPMLSSTASHPFADSVVGSGSQSSFVPFSPAHHHQQQLLHAVAGPLTLQDHPHSSSSSSSNQSASQEGQATSSEGQQIVGSAVQTNQQFQARRLFQEWTLQFGNLANHHHHHHHQRHLNQQQQQREQE